MSLDFNIGDRVEVAEQNIRGIVVFAVEGMRIVIEDDDAETDDNRLEFDASELRLYKDWTEV